MAQVFLAQREGPEGFAKPYVIKRILPELANDEQFARLFVIEAKVAALLDHPNIVHVFDFEMEKGEYFLVMEYVAGASLAQIMRANRRCGTPLGPPLAVEIGAAVAHALAYAHDLTLPDGKRLDLVHRDISPGNILVSRDGAVKLADFGVVKTSMNATVTGVVNGKWSYMSPEQVSGQASDLRSDLFSLGIVLYEIITGVRLFRGESDLATASRVMNAVIERPSTMVKDLDSKLESLVMKLLERDPARRYQTAAGLAADLEVLRALPAFSGGGAALRGLVRSLFPEASQTPALGASFGDRSRPTSMDVQNLLGPAARAETPPVRALSAFRNLPPSRLMVVIAAACLIASAVFWLLVL